MGWNQSLVLFFQIHMIYFVVWRMPISDYVEKRTRYHFSDQVWKVLKTVSFVLNFFSYAGSGVLDLILNFPGYHRWKFTDVMRNILKLLVSCAWAVILPLCYIHSFVDPNQIRDVLSGIGEIDGGPTLYILAVYVYLIPNLLAAVLFIFPMLRRWIENSDWIIVRLLLWWSQVYIYMYPFFFLWVVLFFLELYIYLLEIGLIILTPKEWSYVLFHENGIKANFYPASGNQHYFLRNISNLNIIDEWFMCRII